MRLDGERNSFARGRQRRERPRRAGNFVADAAHINDGVISTDRVDQSSQYPDHDRILARVEPLGCGLGLFFTSADAAEARMILVRDRRYIWFANVKTRVFFCNNMASSFPHFLVTPDKLRLKN